MADIYLRLLWVDREEADLVEEDVLNRAFQRLCDVQCCTV